MYFFFSHFVPLFMTHHHHHHHLPSGMLDCIPDVELDNPEKINGVSKQRIADKAGESIDDVNKLLHFYKHSAVMQGWLSMK
jgi:signal recognition particle GTPase